MVAPGCVDMCSPANRTADAVTRCGAGAPVGKRLTDGIVADASRNVDSLAAWPIARGARRIALCRARGNKSNRAVACTNDRHVTKGPTWNRALREGIRSARAPLQLIGRVVDLRRWGEMRGPPSRYTHCAWRQ